VFWLCF